MASACCLAACPSASEADLPPVPDLSLEAFAPAARDQVKAALDLLRQRPTDPWANGDLAALLHARGQVEAAQALYLRAEALSAGEFRWSYLRGVALQDAGRPAEAEVSLRRAIARRRHPPALVRLGRILADGGQGKEAEGVLREALADAASEAAASYALGRLLLERGQTDQAVALLERCLELAPGSSAARYALGTARRAAGDEAGAEQALAAAGSGSEPTLEDPVLDRVRARAADEHHWLNRGRELEAAGRTPEAVDAYLRALALEPAMATAHANLVGAYGRAGRFAEAAEHYRAAVAADPEIEELHNNWGVIQARRGDPAAAAAAFRRALEINARSAGAHANLAAALIEMGRIGEAKAHFEQAIETDPANRAARSNLAKLALDGGRPAEAVNHLQAALRDPANDADPVLRRSLGIAYLHSGRHTEGLRALQAALLAANAADLDDLAARVRADLQAAER